MENNELFVEPLSLKNKRKQRFFYYLYSHDHEAVLALASKLGISASEVIRYLIEFRLNSVESTLEKR